MEPLGTCEGAKFSLCYILVCNTENQRKWPDLLLLYHVKESVLSRNVQEICICSQRYVEGYLESIVHILQVSTDDSFQRDSFHDTLSIKFFVFLTHLEEKQQ